MKLNVGRHERPLKGEDTILQNDDLRLYGVFDGLGGHGDGDVASKTSSEAVEAYFVANPPHTDHQAKNTMLEAFSSASQALKDSIARLAVNQTMATTASVIHFFNHEDGKEKYVLGHIGDSWIYSVGFGAVGGSFSELTYDEATKHGLTNVLSARSSKCEQLRVGLVNYPRRFVIGSDGISGRHNWPFSKVFEQALYQANPQRCAEELVRQSWIEDDRSVLAIDFVKE